ncbi:MAG: ABC transporter permease [Dysosmobacter welbionis]
MHLVNALPGVAAQGLIWGIMAIGVYITFRILDVADLTVDGTMATGGAAFIMLTMAGAPVPLAMLGAFLAGVLAGLVTGLFHTACGIPAILAGILTQLALYSVNLRIMGQANRPVSSRQYDLLVDQQSVRSLSLDNPILVVAICGGGHCPAVLVLRHRAGCLLRATGSNPNMSRAQGINTNFTKVLGLMLSNGLVALSSALLAQYQGFADVNMGRGAIVIGLAAVIIGEVIFGKVFRNFALKMLAVAIGAMLYSLVYQVVIWLGLNTDDMKLITALIVAAFLAIPYWKGKYAHVKVPAGSANAGAKTGGDQDA